jgi:hypothetical protein
LLHLCIKLVAKYTEGIFPLCLRGGAEYRAEIAHTGVEQLSSPCGESQALHCLGETGNKLKMTDSLREKLNNNSQA